MPIEYTGMEQPDVIIVVSADGLKELTINGTLARARAGTLVVMDEELEAPPIQGRVVRLALRKKASPQRAALAAIAAWQTLSPALPPTAWDAAIETLTADRRTPLREAFALGGELVTPSG